MNDVTSGLASFSESGKYKHLVDSFNTTLEHVANSSSSIEDDGLWKDNAYLRTRAPLPTLTWERAIEKGKLFLCLLEQPLGQVTQSKYTDYAAVQQWGWNIETLEDVDVPNDDIFATEAETEAITAIYIDLELRSGNEYNKVVELVHEREVTLDGKVYPPTMAVYKNFFCLGPTYGAILAPYNYGPDARGSGRRPPVTGSEVIPLKQWSDLVFLAWQNFQQKQAEPEARMQNLRYVFRMQIANVDTESIVSRVMGGVAASVWPGKTFKMTTDEGKALLGTPHGSGIAWLLAQHKKQLGLKTVDEVTVYRLTTGQPTSLCFALKDIGGDDDGGEDENEGAEEGVDSSHIGLALPLGEIDD